MANIYIIHKGPNGTVINLFTTKAEAQTYLREQEITEFRSGWTTGCDTSQWLDNQALCLIGRQVVPVAANVIVSWTIPD
jgi:hypothetical protein